MFSFQGNEPDTRLLSHLHVFNGGSSSRRFCDEDLNTPNQTHGRLDLTDENRFFILLYVSPIIKKFDGF